MPAAGQVGPWCKTRMQELHVGLPHRFSLMPSLLGYQGAPSEVEQLGHESIFQEAMLMLHVIDQSIVPQH